MYTKWNGNQHYYYISGPTVRCARGYVWSIRVLHVTQNWFIQTTEPELDRTIKPFSANPDDSSGLSRQRVAGAIGAVRGCDCGYPDPSGRCQLWCVRDFYVIGKGTLAPWDPPKKLVTVGLYRYVRNPIYVGVVGFVAGCSLIAGSRRMAVYAAVLAVGFHLRVIFYEEPTLARLFGIQWHVYRANVNRWWPEPPIKSGRRYA